MKKFKRAMGNLFTLNLFFSVFQFVSLTFISSDDKVIRVYMNTVIKVKIIITVGIKIILFSRRAWIVNHLGMNPKKGGIPLRDKKFNIKNIFVIMLVFIDW